MIIVFLCLEIHLLCVRCAHEGFTDVCLCPVAVTGYQVMQHPHKFILYYIEYLKESGMSPEHADKDKMKALAQHAWAFLNDSMRIDLCLRHDTKQIACAAILIASRHDEVQIPLPAPEWMQVLGGVQDDIERIADEILELYELQMPSWLDPLNADSHLNR